MDKTEELMSDIYNTLVQIRYPKITTALIKNVDLVILSGENRISLLSWLLAEKCPATAIKLQKLKGVPLEEELLKCYSEIGICTDKNLLFGNCKLEEQLPFLQLLLDFMKCVFIESSDIKCEEQVSIDDILHVYINEDPNIITSNIEPKLNYSESLQYFYNLQKSLIEYEKLSSSYNLKKEEVIKNEVSNNNEDQTSLFDTEKKKFIEAFSEIKLWPMFNTKNAKSNLYSMDINIRDIYSNFSSLTQFLHAKEEISNANIPKEINKINASLHEIVENAVVATEEALNIVNDY